MNPSSNDRQQFLQEMEYKLKQKELELKEMELSIRRQDVERQQWQDRESRRDNRFSNYGRTGCLVGGVVLVGAGIADALLNPFAFIEAPKLLIAGVGLMVVGATGKMPGGTE